eukprot:1322719-Amorphochlora_amoeboformis.AAC.1
MSSMTTSPDQTRAAASSWAEGSRCETLRVLRTSLSLSLAGRLGGGGWGSCGMRFGIFRALRPGGRGLGGLPWG